MESAFDAQVFLNRDDMLLLSSHETVSGAKEFFLFSVVEKSQKNFYFLRS